MRVCDYGPQGHLQDRAGAVTALKSAIEQSMKAIVLRGLNMTKFVMLITTAVLSVCAQPLAAVADEVPTYDVRKTCRADVQVYPGGGSAAGCLADEQKAREVLVSQWTQFGPESRAKCTQMVNDIAGDQSYVELLGCLQDAKAVKTLPKD
jgi:hypothetical protein